MQEHAESAPRISGAPDAAASGVGAAEVDASRAAPYVARILQQHLIDDPGGRWWTSDGTAVFVDISGFTKLSERLARKGREGAEQITEAIGSSFEAILAVAYDNGGSLLKFGGDALLMWFEGEGHAARACRATVLMRRVLREVGRIEVPGAKVTLRMTQGVHSGRFHFFAVGSSHFEFLPVGPAWSRLVAMEHGADAGEIVVSPETAVLLQVRCLGDPKGPGTILRREPTSHREKLPLMPRPKMAAATIAQCLPVAVRAHVLAGGGTSEHRPVTIAFVHFEKTDAMLERDGPGATAEALHQLVSIVEAATDKHGVSLLASDVDADGGKLILTAGAPSIAGDDEERMLLALRSIVDARLSIPIRIGVHRGSVFAGDIGPFYRRTYTVMGDAVNLSARLMAKAEPGHIYATADVLDRSNTLFATTELPPFAVKGKAQPIQAWSVGRAVGSRKRNVSLERLPLIGRDAELALLRDALASARSGAGRLIDIVGELGTGKTRLLQALREEATGMRVLSVTCEAYSAATPYAVWRELLREFMDIRRDDPDALVAERIEREVKNRIPDLTPWLPLIGIAFGVEIASTPEVEMLAENNRRPKLHEAVGRFLEVMMPDPLFGEIENAQHMDVASAKLLSFVAGTCHARPWLIGVARRTSESGFVAPDLPTVVRVELEALTPEDALRFTKLATERNPLPIHVLEIVARRSGGNPQFLRDLLHSAVHSGGVHGLPDSAESAAMSRIDALAPEDRALVRRASVFGLTFHPRMLAWFADEDGALQPDAETWKRLHQLFEQEADGYIRFRRSLLRDAAYEGLPYKLRRRLHRLVATRLEAEFENPEESADILSLHYVVAGEYGPAWRYARIAARHADAVYAYVEAARLYARALEAGRRMGDVADLELASVGEALGDSWHRAGDYPKASDAFTAARRLAAGDSLRVAGLLLKQSKMEEKLGKYPQALRWAARARKVIEGLTGPDAARQSAHLSGWYATVLQAEGRSSDAIRWAQRAIKEAEAVDDPEAIGTAYFVLGWVYGDLGRDGVEPLWRRALEAFRRAGNVRRQAGLLANLGVACGWEGRWDEAVSYFEQAREESIKIGNTVDAELARINIAEILTDRGELTQAQTLLDASLPMWRALNYRYFLGACYALLGRVALRAGRPEAALARFEEAKTLFEDVGSQQDVLDVDSRIAECRVFMADPKAALELAAATLARVGSPKSVPKAVALLERVRGQALLQQGNLAGARKALEASLAAGRARRDLFETALTLLAFVDLAHREGVEPAPEIMGECQTLLDRLKVSAVPALPLAAV